VAQLKYLWLVVAVTILLLAFWIFKFNPGYVLPQKRQNFIDCGLRWDAFSFSIGIQFPKGSPQVGFKRWFVFTVVVGPAFFHFESIPGSVK